MKPVNRLTIDHDNYRGDRLHNDLNKLVSQTNENFASHDASLIRVQGQLASQGAQITALLAQIKSLQNT